MNKPIKLNQRRYYQSLAFSKFLGYDMEVFNENSGSSTGKLIEIYDDWIMLLERDKKKAILHLFKITKISDIDIILDKDEILLKENNISKNDKKGINKGRIGNV